MHEHGSGGRRKAHYNEGHATTYEVPHPSIGGVCPSPRQQAGTTSSCSRCVLLDARPFLLLQNLDQAQRVIVEAHRGATNRRQQSMRGTLREASCSSRCTPKSAAYDSLGFNIIQIETCNCQHDRLSQTTQSSQVQSASHKFLLKGACHIILHAVDAASHHHTPELFIGTNKTYMH